MLTYANRLNGGCIMPCNKGYKGSKSKKTKRSKRKTYRKAKRG